MNEPLQACLDGTFDAISDLINAEAAGDVIARTDAIVRYRIAARALDDWYVNEYGTIRSQE
nr:hypothetical protein [Rhodococcus sp. (in: high G+C Gram-positive bacteria)]